MRASKVHTLVAGDKTSSAPDGGFLVQATQEQARLEARKQEILTLLAPYHAELQRITAQLAALNQYLQPSHTVVESLPTGRKTPLLDKIAGVLSQAPHGMSAQEMYRQFLADDPASPLAVAALQQCLWRHKDRFTAIHRGVYILTTPP